MKHKPIAPLRKVIGTIEVEAGEFHGRTTYYHHELLECFHHQSVKQDVYGQYYANKRRCKRCAHELQLLSVSSKQP